MADLRAKEIKRFFNLFGFDVRSDPTSRHATSERPGRSDLVLSLYGRSVFVEIKNGRDRWTTKTADPKKGWTQSQRNYGLWAETINGTPYFIALMVGTKPPNYDREKYLSRRFYLIPYRYALEAVVQAESYANFIPAVLHERMRPKIFRSIGMSCASRFSRFELPYLDKNWGIPNTHPFYEYIIDSGGRL